MSRPWMCHIVRDRQNLNWMKKIFTGFEWG
nr:MAG TPA: hypothetical protein [Caudoviricetes sp.]